MQELRKGQKSVLEHLQTGKSLLACLPTGYGKSLCYAKPAGEWKWRTIVISPLKALMQDQQQALQAQGIKAWDFHSGLRPDVRKERLQKIWRGDWELLLLSPERINQWYEDGTWARLQKLWPVKLLAIDEVHAATRWREFRPHYQSLDSIVQEVNAQGAQVLGLSATLTAEDQQELEARWKIPLAFVSEELGRENLYLEVRTLERKKEKWIHLCSLLRDLPPSQNAIVYCFSREQTEVVANFLSSYGIPATAFHAGLPDSWKTQRTEDFLRGRVKVLCATNAFGMGIHSSKIARIIHWGLPLSILEYWQQAGRAGRSGAAASSILLWCRSDIFAVRRMAKVEEMQVLLRFLLSSRCRKSVLAQHFGIFFPNEGCGNCDNCNFSQRKNFSKEPWWLRFSEETEKNFLALLRS